MEIKLWNFVQGTYEAMDDNAEHINEAFQHNDALNLA